MITFALTGATGLIGSHLLFEIIKQNISQLNHIHILVLGRHKGRISLRERIEAIFNHGGYSYLGNIVYDLREVQHFLRHQLVCIDMPLDQNGAYREEQLGLLRQKPIDFFFHLAALPDLRDRPETEAKVMKINYLGTQRLLEVIEQCQVKEFNFVGTAFVCGKHSGRITPDFINFSDEFNNPYERSKLMAESAVREFAANTGIRCRIFRPSIVCGRLIEQPLGYISKFDVFYHLFGTFYVLKALLEGNNAGTQTTDLQLRAVFSPESSANFVPVDYLVKLLYQICWQKAEGDSFHLVHQENSYFGDFLVAASEEMGITGVRGVDKEPIDKTYLETIYYNRVGGLFEAYHNTLPKFFDTNNEQQVIRQAGLYCPAMNHENIKLLIRYAVKQHFGLPMEKVLTKIQMNGE